MQDFFSGLLDKFWLKYISLVIFAGIGFIIIQPFIPNETQKLGFAFFFILGVIVFLFFYYAVCTIKHNSVPRVYDDKLGVLFLISSEDKKTFEHIRYCLSQKCEEISEESSKSKISAICMDKNDFRIRKYALDQEEDCKNLLVKTNCLFIVRIRYTTDDLDNSENYEILIKYGYILPNITDNIQKLLREEMNLFSEGLQKQRFSKQESISIFNTTASKLSMIFEYFYGISFLLTNKCEVAMKIFADIISQISSMENDEDIVKPLLTVVSDKYIMCCFALAQIEYEKYKTSFEKSTLYRIQTLLNNVNILKPDMYDYHVNRAVIEFLLTRNVDLAYQFLAKCKEQKSRQEWKYSDAFLCAYSCDNPWKIYRKYEQALKCDVNVVEIIAFTEQVLFEEPIHKGLHFALALLYYNIKDNTLAKEHMIKYFEFYKAKYNNIDINLVKLCSDIASPKQY